jgi:hypothetical protein
MLRRRGGSGTINPDTGLPEFFIKKIFKGVGKALKSVGQAVKKFANSTVGRIVTTVALGFFLGPAAASALGATSAAGVAAVSGFVGSAGSTLMAGGNLKDALKAGAVGGLTAGAGAGIMGGSGAFQAGSYTGPTTIGGQFDKFKSAITPGPLQQAAAPSAPTLPPTGEVAAQMPVPDAGAVAAPVQMPVPDADPLGNFIQQNEAARAAANVPAGGQPGMFDQVKDFYNKNISPSGIRAEALPGAQDAGAKAVTDLLKRVPTATPAMQEAAYQKAFGTAMPGAIGTYAPMTALGIGELGAAGGFEQKQPGLTPEAQAMQERVATERQTMAENPGMFTPKGFERFGAVYDDKGRITSWNAWTPESAGAFTQYQNRGAQMPNAGLASLMPARFADGGAVRPSYESLTASSTPAQIAAAYKDYAAASGGDTQANQERAVDFLSKLGVSAPTIESAYNTYLGRGAAPAASAAAPAAGAAVSRPPLYESLTSSSSPLQIAAAYEQYANMSGGDIQANQNRAADYLRKLGVSDPNITSAYNLYLGKPAAGVTTKPDNDLLSRFEALQSQYTSLQDRINELLATQKKAMSPPTISWNTMPNFSNYQVATQGSPLVPTQSVLGGQVMGLTDPFSAGKSSPLRYLVPQPYNNASMYGNVMSAQPAAQTATGTPMMASGGIASLASGGYPRRTGQIEGPGTETSDEIPAMLSDGEFVMTAKAVRGAGGGSRRDGAKKMYALMHRLEKNATRG